MGYKVYVPFSVHISRAESLTNVEDKFMENERKSKKKTKIRIKL